MNGLKFWFVNLKESEGISARKYKILHAMKMFYYILTRWILWGGIFCGDLLNFRSHVYKMFYLGSLT